ncbi:MAG TPA: 7TM diverse intracellular signaling domain-containing protein, partial [Cytophagaceae bacterium]
MKNRLVEMRREYVAAITGMVFLINFSLHATSFNNIEVLAEGEHKYSIDQVINSKLPFKPYKEGNYSDKRLKTYWIRFVYERKNIPGEYYIMYPFVMCRNADIYYHINDTLLHYHSGINTGFHQRNLYFPNLYVKLPNSERPITCWLRIESFFGATLWLGETDIKEIVQEETTATQMVFFLIGLAFLAGVFGFIFFIFLNDKMYLYYSIFSFFVIFSRLLNTGYLYNFTTGFYSTYSFKNIYDLFSITSIGLNLTMILYFHEFLKFYPRSKKYHKWLYSMFVIRFILYICHLCLDESEYSFLIDNRFYDLIILGFLLLTAIQTPKRYNKLSMCAALSIAILIFGNLLDVMHLHFSTSGNSYQNFLNFAGVEVIAFAISMGYRTNFLKNERDKAIEKTVEALKERELLKDQVNKELEIQVNDRTKELIQRNNEILEKTLALERSNEEIEKMNSLLRSHNIELKSEVTNANEARLFHKVMSFRDFKNIFPDDDFCYKYLSRLKWKSDQPY